MKSEVIANPRAERVRRVSELADRKGRKRSGRFMVEGPQSVRELLSWHPDIVEDLYVEVVSAEPDAAFITPTVAQMAGKAMQAGAYVHKVTHAVMQHMSSDAQGVLAVADMRAFLDSAVIDGDSDERTMVAAFWQVRDPGNAGTVIRSADAAGCAGVVLVDDSIVRGTTSRRIVTMLKEAGATEVHVRIASPPMTHPCFYGVDTSTRDELISARKEVDGVRAEICADSLAFLSPGALLRAGNRKDLCMACFTGHYPTALYQSVDEVNKDVKC